MVLRWGIVSDGSIAHDLANCIRRVNRDEHDIVGIVALDPNNINGAHEFAHTKCMCL